MRENGMWQVRSRVALHGCQAQQSKGEIKGITNNGSQHLPSFVAKDVWLIRMDCEKEDDANILLILYLVDKMLYLLFALSN